MAKRKVSENHDIVILGGGISGLTLAHTLGGRGRSVLLAETTDRLGGVIRSDKVDGYLLERGPNSFTSAPAVDRLLREIGLHKQAIRRPLREYDRFVYKGGRLRKVPTGPLELLATDCLSIGGKLRLLTGLFSAHQPPRGDLSLGDYFRPRLGDELVDTLLRPFIAGVYAADADRLSFEAALPRLYAPALENRRLIGAVRSMMKERRQSSPPVRGRKRPKALVSFPDGLEEFPRRLELATQKRGVTIRMETSYRLLRQEDGAWILEDDAGNLVRAGKVVLAMPAGKTADALNSVAPEISSRLRGIQYARLTVVHAGVSAWDVRAREKGFGFLNAQLPREWRGNPAKRARVLGMIWSDQIFPGRSANGMRLYTCFYGGEKDPEGNDLDNEAIARQLQHDMELVLRLRPGTGPTFMEVTRWEKALPIFSVGQAGELKRALAGLPGGLHLLSSFQGGISIPDRVEKARQLAESL